MRKHTDEIREELAPVTPGEVLLDEFLRPMGISQSKLARDLGVPPNRVNQIARGKREITADTALRFAEYFNIEPEFWLNLQTRYNLKIAARLFNNSKRKNRK